MAVASNPQTLEPRPPAILEEGVVIEMPDLAERRERLAESIGETVGSSVLPSARTHMQELLGETFGWRRAIRTLEHAEEKGRRARTLTEELLGEAARLIHEGKIKPPKMRTN